MDNEIPPINNEMNLNKLNLDQYQSNVVTTTEEQLKQENQKEENKKQNEIIYHNLNEENKKPTIKKSSIWGTTFMITNICLGTTIYTFAVRAKKFGLVWLLFFVFSLLL